MNDLSARLDPRSASRTHAELQKHSVADWLADYAAPENERTLAAGLKDFIVPVRVKRPGLLAASNFKLGHYRNTDCLASTALIHRPWKDFLLTLKPVFFMIWHLAVNFPSKDGNKLRSRLPSAIKPFLLQAVLFLWLALVTAPAAPIGTLFTYQGQLNSGNSRANGSYDLQFEIYDSPTNGTRVGPILTNTAVLVNNGLFTAPLDFGAGIFTAEARWLQISVKTNDAPAFITLTPRQQLTTTPYAVEAAVADAVSASHINGVLPDALLSTNVPLLTGSNFFQGPLILTNFASTFAGQFFGNGAGLTNIPPVSTVLTTNSTFAEIKAAIAKGGLIWFQPGDYWSIDTLELTNNTVILGWNAILHAKPGFTGFLIDEAPSTENISVYGLSVTADRYLPYSAPDFISLTPWPSPYYQTKMINQSGMRLNMASGGTTAGCSAYGFGGYGFMLISRNEYNEAGLLGSFFHDNHAYYDAVGVGVLGPTYEYPGTPYAPVDENTNNITAEHQLISGNEMFENGMGLYAPAGNCVIIGNKITGNNFGVVLMNGPNNAHGEIIGNTLNHNNYGLVAVSLIGETIRNNLFLDVNSIYIYAAGYLTFDGNQLNGSPGMTVTVTNNPGAPPSYVTFSHNFYRGSWGRDFILNTNFGPASGATYVYGNRSLDVSNDTDGSMISLTEIGEGATTNYTIPGGPTFYVTNGVIVKIQ